MNMEGLPGLKILQVNLNRCWEAQQLCEQAIKEKEIDVAIISEPYQCNIEKRSRYRAQDGLAEIRVSQTLLERGISVNEIFRSKGIITINIGGVLCTSVYISPNVKWEVFDAALQDIERAHSYGAGGEYMIMGDFNARSPYWGSTSQDRRGGAILDLCAKIGATPVRSSGAFTFEKNGRRSLIDIMLCSKGSLEKLKTSSILDDYNGSDHRYVLHCFVEGRQIKMGDTGIGQRGKKKFSVPVFRDMLKKHLDHWTPKDWTKKEQVQALISIVEICAMASLRSPPKRHGQKQAAWWWNENIANRRRTALKTRRKMQKVMKRSDGKGIEKAREEHKKAQKSLKGEIRSAKKEGWINFLDSIDNDPWGRPYKAVIKALKGVAPPAVINCEKAKEIIEQLFTTKKRQEREKRNPWEGFVNSRKVRLRTVDVKSALTLLKEKAPGLDRTPVAAIREMFKVSPELVTRIMGSCLDMGWFPEVWKEARLVLLPKGKTQEMGAKGWRPICLLSNWAKLLEHITKARLVQGLKNSENQYGFRKGRSTVHAIDRLMALWDAAKATGKHCLLVTIDVKNAFNSLTWESIMNEVHNRHLHISIVNILKDYLRNRMVKYEAVDGTICRSVYAGVPQGSVLGPTLWNLVYDGLLNTKLLAGAHLIGYADDVAVVVVERELDRVTEIAQDTLSRLNRWFVKQKLEVAHEKTKMVLLTGRRIKTPVRVRHGDQIITAERDLPYLGVTIEGNQMFKAHIRNVCVKAIKVAGALARISPNIRGGSYVSRLLHYRTTEAVVLYAAPIWASELCIQINENELKRAQRAALSRVARAYRTVSHDALCVLTGVPPLHITASERKKSFMMKIMEPGKPVTEKDRREEKDRIMARWQAEWNVSTVGKWTQEIVPRLRKWVKVGPKILTYRLTQALTGHGCFAAYLCKIGRRTSPMCWFGCGVPDDARHTLFQCQKWETQRTNLQDTCGNFSESTLVKLLLSKKSSEKCREYVDLVIKEKEMAEMEWEKAARSRKK